MPILIIAVAIASGLLLVTSNVLWKYPARRFGVLPGLALRNVLMTLWATAAYLLDDGAKPLVFNANNNYLIWPLVVCASSYGGLLLLNLGIRRSDAAVVVPTANITPIFVGLWALLIFGEGRAVGLAGPAVVVFSGLALMPVAYLKKQNINGLRYGFAAATLWGICYALFKPMVDELGATAFTLLLEGTICVCALVHLAVSGQWRTFRHTHWPSVGILAAISLITIVAVLLGNWVFEQARLIDLSILGGLGPVLSMIMAWLIFRESIPRLAWLAAVVISAGLVWYLTA